MNLKIKKYWENQGKVIFTQTEPDEFITNVPMYYYIDNNVKELICCHYDSKLVYYFEQEGDWYFEQDMLNKIND